VLLSGRDPAVLQCRIANLARRHGQITSREKRQEKTAGKASLKHDSDLKLYIKSLASIRCKLLVQEELDKLGLHYGITDLGEVVVKENVTTERLQQINGALLKLGLELIDDEKAAMVENIKVAIVALVRSGNDLPKRKNSDFISTRLNLDYAHLSTVFSEVMGITIEHYIIAHRIELVKELLLSNGLSLTEISSRLNYSSVAHLSNQFKKVTGITPTVFKQVDRLERKSVVNKGIM